MKKFKNCLRIFLGQWLDPTELFRRSFLDLLQAAKFPEQSFPLDLSDPWNFVEDGLQTPFPPELPMVPYGKAMRLIADLLQEAQGRRMAGEEDGVFDVRKVDFVRGAPGFFAQTPFFIFCQADGCDTLQAELR